METNPIPETTEVPTMSATTTWHCPIDDECSGTVKVHDEGFHATTVTVGLCPVCQAKMIEAGYFRDYEIRKSALAQMDQVGTRQSTFQHVAGLVVFTG